MIIVSQDKTAIINFENIKTIELDRATNSTSINIYRETNEVETGVCGLFIGHYKTEERAKEVLQEIVNRYKEYTTIQNITGNDIRGIYNTPKVYEML